MLKSWRYAVGIGLFAASAMAAPMSVQVQNGQLRGTPSFLGAVVAPLSYGQQVEVVREQGAWINARTADGQLGWVHQSALSKKRIVMKAGGQNAQTGASSDELALSSKGFSSDVEAKFKADHKDIDFTWVDKMAKIKVDQGEMVQFLKTGGLTPVEGGAK